MDKLNFLKKRSKSIVIYNPLSNIGHFDSWCSIFVKILLESGWAVIVVTKNAKMLLDGFDIAGNPNLLVLDQASDIRADRKFALMELLIHKINIFKFIDNIKLNDRRSNQSLFNVVMSFTARVINYFLRKVEYSLLKLLPEKLKISFNNPIDFASDINLVVKMFGAKPSFVLNMYLDLYNPKLKVWDKFSREMSCMWGGIHMDLSHALKDRSYSRSKSLKVIYTINNPIESVTNARSSDIDWQWLPDVTDVTLPARKSQVVLNIEKLAAGRKIIFLGGAIGGSKNLSLWSELFFNLDHSHWYFVQIGKIEYPTLTSEDLIALHKLQNSKVENIYISDAFLTDESIFNEVMSISSIIWGLYRDFDRSSNILTKAALLSKPIIVSDRFLMGQRINAYKIGIAVPETSVADVLLGVDWLINNPIPFANFERYANVYSASALSKKLNESLLKIIQ